MFSPTNEKTPYEQLYGPGERESQGSVGSRSIVHKFRKRLWTKPDIVSMAFLCAVRLATIS